MKKNMADLFDLGRKGGNLMAFVHLAKEIREFWIRIKRFKQIRKKRVILSSRRKRGKENNRRRPSERGRKIQFHRPRIPSTARKKNYTRGMPAVERKGGPPAGKKNSPISVGATNPRSPAAPSL